jgi:hypothetical protein
MRKSALLLAVAISWFGQTAELKADHHKTHLIDELKDASWQLGTWKWEGSGDDKSGKGFVTFKAVMGGAAIQVEGHWENSTGKGSFLSKRYYDQERKVIIDSGSNSFNQAWENLVTLTKGKTVMHSTEFHPETLPNGTLPGVYSTVMVQKMIDTDTWEHAVTEIGPDGEITKKPVARLVRSK